MLLHVINHTGRPYQSENNDAAQWIVGGKANTIKLLPLPHPALSSVFMYLVGREGGTTSIDTISMGQGVPIRPSEWHLVILVTI